MIIVLGQQSQALEKDMTLQAPRRSKGPKGLDEQSHRAEVTEGAPYLLGRGLVTQRRVSLPDGPLVLHYRPFPGQGDRPQSRKRSSRRLQGAAVWKTANLVPL